MTDNGFLDEDFFSAMTTHMARSTNAMISLAHLSASVIVLAQEKPELAGLSIQTSNLFENAGEAAIDLADDIVKLMTQLRWYQALTIISNMSDQPATLPPVPPTAIE